MAADRFASVDFGPIPAGKTTAVPGLPGAYDVEGYGRMFGLHLSSDQGRFVYTRIAGDFEITARIHSIHNDKAAFAEAGLMVRRDLSPTGLMLGQFVTNNEYHGKADQYTFPIRLKESGKLIDGPTTRGPLPKSWGNDTFAYFASGFVETDASTKPRPFPNVWLRIRREGSTYSGLFKAGDADWRTLGHVTLDLGPEPYIGMAISANHHGGDSNTRTVVQYRDLAGFPTR